MDCSTPGFSHLHYLPEFAQKLLSTELVILSNHLILCQPLLLLLQFFPASGSFQMSLPFPSGGQSIGASASVLIKYVDNSDLILFYYVCSTFYKFLFYIVNIVDLQCCVGFRRIAKSFRYMYIFLHIYPFFFRFFSNIGYYRILNRLPCGIQSKPDMRFSPVFPGFQSTTHLVLIQMPPPPGSLPIPLYLTFHPSPVNLITLFLFYIWFVYETLLLATWLSSSIRIRIP